jgi:hypothetical protein
VKTRRGKLFDQPHVFFLCSPEQKEERAKKKTSNLQNRTEKEQV